MNISKLFEAQRALDKHVEERHPRKRNENRLNKKVIGFLVEISEMLNEKRSVFKFWSDKPDDDEKTLIEYVDGIHFLLSIGLELNAKPEMFEPNVLDYNNIEAQILETYHSASQITEFSFHSYVRTFELYLGLGELLGFDWNKVETAYFKKNEINHARQAQGY